MKMALHLCCLALSFLASSSLFVRGVGAFNLDPYSVTVLQPSTDSALQLKSYFGYSHTFLRENDVNWLIVGAPKANVTGQPGHLQQGTVYKCRLADDAMKNGVCTELIMDFEPDTVVPEGNYRAHKYDQWLGAAMDASSNSEEIVACGHRRMYSGNFTNLPGICFYRNGTNDSSTRKLSKGHAHLRQDRLVDNWHPRNQNFSFYLYRYQFAEWGISVRLSTEGHTVMGAPGLWTWQGGFLVDFGNDQTCAVVNVTLVDSYLGYSVTSIRWPKNGQSDKFLFAGGAPRYNESGAVYLVEVSTSNIPLSDISECKNKTLLQSIVSTNYGSYFGASILAADVDGDGWDELFVGAPFENRTLGDEGAVHYYVLNAGKREFVKSKVLLGIGQESAHFGTAIASAGDLNFDGFNDVVIGSPFEDGRRGAIYIFNGSPTGIEQIHSQRIAATNLPQLNSIKSFGHSLNSGRDIDGNKYPDVSIGAYMSDSVAIIRSRPVHNVTAEIWFPDGIISWQRPNCSKTSDDQSFDTTLVISFLYTIPEEEKKNIKNTFILVDHRQRKAFLDPNQRITFIDGGQSSRQPIQFFVVPCLKEGLSNNKRCVSFLAADRHATYMRLFDRNFYLDSKYTPKYLGNYNDAVSFILSEDPVYERIMTVSCVAMQDHLLVSDEHGNLTTKQMAGGDRRDEAQFRFTSGKYLPCIRDLSYELRIDGDNDRRAHFRHPDGTRYSLKDNINFHVEDLDQPLNRTWKVVFPRYPKNIATPMRFRLSIIGPSFASDSRSSSEQNASTNRIVFDRLLPVLSKRTEKMFTGEIGFKKECGDDDVCHTNLSVNLTLPKGEHGRGLVIGGKAPLEPRFYIQNSGEAAYSVRLEVIHASLLLYNKPELDDLCNQVTCVIDMMTMKEASNSSSANQKLLCDVENQVQTNGSVAFRVRFDPTKFREESDFSNDFMELQYRVGTHGQIRNDTSVLSFQIPLRIEAKLDAFGRTKEPEILFNSRAAESKKSDELTLTMTHDYPIENKGPGVMPSVAVDVFLPEDSQYNVSKVISVTVTVEGSRSNQQFKRDVNGTMIFETPIATPTIVSGTENVSQAAAASGNGGQNDGSAVVNFLSSVIGQEEKKSITVHCAPGYCSVIRRYNIGAMYVGDKAVVSVKVEISAVKLSKIKSLSKFNYTSYIRLSPYNLSEAVKTWRERKAKIVATDLQTSTIFRPKTEQPSIPIWLIVVGVGVGLLHIVAFVLILKKCGFFRRKQYEQLKDKMRESRIDQVMSTDPEAEQLEVASQYDNELLREQVSMKSQSQYSAAGSYGNGSHGGDDAKKGSSTVDALHAQHPGIDFTAE